MTFVKNTRTELPTAPGAPRTWSAMLDAWGAMLGSLCSVLPEADADTGRRIAARYTSTYAPPSGSSLPLAAWRWMWSLPPCSEARKCAFSLGVAALRIERWRSVLASLPADSDIGQAAETALRIVAWHVQDARGQAAAIRYHGATVEIPPHERVYTNGPAPDGGTPALTRMMSQHPGLARAILDDYVEHRRADRTRLSRCLGATNLRDDDAVRFFAERCVASMPDGHWVMTSSDVGRFLDMFIEEHTPTGERPVSQRTT